MVMITTRDLVKRRRAAGSQQAGGRVLSLHKLPKGKVMPPQVRPGMMLYDVVPDGAWNGRPAFIVGGGPSLRGFDWSRLDGELSIGINRAYESYDPTIVFSMDNRYWNDIELAKYGEKARDKFQVYDYGLKCWMDVANALYPNDIVTVGCCGPERWGESLRTGIGSGGNSGFGAVNIAFLLGANPIYLLGFDMKGMGDGRQAWFHSGHIVNQGDKVYKQFKQRFKDVALPPIQISGRKVVNLYPESALTCFPFDTIDNVPRSKMPVVVAFYTPSYAKEAERLKRSLRPWGMRRDIVEVPDLGSWQQNTQHKPQFLLDMLEKHAPHPILYLDADATLERYPALLDGMDERCDIAVHFRNWLSEGRNRPDELLSGTIYIANNDKMRALFESWIKSNEENPDTWDQKTLEMALKDSDAVVEKLPAEYCAIFDGMPEAGNNPVVSQWQASRRLRT